MDAATPPADDADLVLEPVDGALAASLSDQGEDGMRALGLLRDAYRMLADDRYERQGEIADTCVRGAVDALLNLPGATTVSRPAGLKSAAQNLLDAVDAYRPDDEDERVTDSAGRRPRRRDPQEALRQIRQTADALRPELRRPGGYHRRRARNIAERLMGQQLGSAQDHALDAWGKIYSDTSGVLHGSAEQQAAAHYRQVLRLAREVFVPLPGRAQEVVALAELQHPDLADAAVLADWADPRALRYFFLSRPAAAWLELLDDVLLLPDTRSTTGHWPAAPYLDHVAQTDSARAAVWLADHAEAITAAGPDGTAALLRLAGQPGIGLNRQVRTILEGLADPQREVRATDTWLLRLAADWAQDIPLTHRDQDWIFAVEALLRTAVRAEHAVDQESDATAADEAPPTGGQSPEERAARFAARLPEWETARLLAALVATADHTEGGGTRPAAPMVRTVLAALLRDDLRLTDPPLRHTAVFHRDLAEVSLEHPEAFVGPLLARAVLDLAGADAGAGVPLTERTKALAQQVAKADERMRDRMLAAHLDEHHPDAAAGEEDTWWEQARALLPALLAHEPTAEGARLADHLLRHSLTTGDDTLQTRLTAALGTPPGPAELASYDPTGPVRPPRAWRRVWHWSPVLPEAATTPWQPALALLRQARPSGPDDPRTAAPLFEITDPPPTTVTAEQAARLAAEHGPPAAAAALAAADDAGNSRYLMVLRTLIDGDPTAWTTAPAEILHALALPELQAYYLAVAADHAYTPGAFPHRALTDVVAAALAWPPTPTTMPTPAADDEAPAADLAQQAAFRLLTAAWRTDTDLGDHLPVALDHLYALTESLTASAPADPPATDTTGPDPAGHALRCLMEHAHHHTRTTGHGPPEKLITHLSAITGATGHTHRTATALRPRLPLLHDMAPAWVHAHRTTLLTLPADTASPADAWLRRGPLHPQLLAELDRDQLLRRLRDDTPPEIVIHVAHALLHNPAQLGDQHTFFTHLAHGNNAPATVSRLLHRIALDTQPATTETAVILWRAALDASLPEGALAGAGAFARTDIDDTAWLELILASARHTPSLDDPDHIAERTSDHPHSATAAQITALLLAHPSPDPWRDSAVRDHARSQLTHAGQLPPAQQPAPALQELRDALITAGDLDAHRLYPPSSP
ncbi:hypothetical protein ME763_37870 (plasmid) [Streptomyces murinus]|uniref:hypothetical protein n=1 Tax=Streptomyces murinus TaxID=33900 RepID=UPI0023783812|nr:hypothetical protein [Streptomyces murinus]WDO11385.1 hypothetical protein ME763_37870 [Streptomyces murinus]